MMLSVIRKQRRDSGNKELQKCKNMFIYDCKKYVNIRYEKNVNSKIFLLPRETLSYINFKEIVSKFISQGNKCILKWGQEVYKFARQF